MVSHDIFGIEKPKIKDFLRYIINDKSSWVLILSNVITIILAVMQGWSLLFVMLIYWSQSVIIGSFNFIRILSLKKFSTENFKIRNMSVKPTKDVKFSTAIFFAIHYGLFHLIYLAFLTTFNVFWQLEIAASDIIFIPLISLIFFVNHLFSFLSNREKDSKKIPNIGRIMFFPYARIIPMHLIIMFGLFLGGVAIVLFLILKTIADLIMHVLEHYL
jgi:hypothetical protein